MKEQHICILSCCLMLDLINIMFVKKYFFLIFGAIWFLYSTVIYLLIENDFDVNVHLVYFTLYASAVVYLLAILNLVYLIFNYFRKK
jgi:hypothetical protein